jgi:hypothetical protein
MTTNHTPGPWRVEGKEVVSLDRFVCLIDSHGPDDTEKRGNAHLIAAAPELLAALKELQEKFVEVSERYRGASWCYGAEAVSNARAAIVKAEGWE